DMRRAQVDGDPTDGRGSAKRCSARSWATRSSIRDARSSSHTRGRDRRQLIEDVRAAFLVRRSVAKSDGPKSVSLVEATCAGVRLERIETNRQGARTEGVL